MKKMNTLISTALVTAFLGLIPMFATPALTAEKDPCAEDVSKFCRDFPPTKAAISSCLESHEKELSASCREYRSKMTGRREEMREEMMSRSRFYQACKGDMVTFCKDVKRELPEIVKCLSDHESRLTGPCGEEIRARRTPVKATKDKKME